MPRYIVIHCEEPMLDCINGTPANAFGPFDSWEEADAYSHDDGHDETCFKVAIVIVGPDQRDIDATAEREVIH